MQTGYFVRFDYGVTKNLKVYGQQAPPSYPLGNVDFPVHYFAGTLDILSNPKDVVTLAKSLKNCPKKWFKFYVAGHCSFFMGL